jgi:hypothetical protein
MWKTGRLFWSIFLWFSLIWDEKKPRIKAPRLHEMLISQISRFPNKGERILKNRCEHQSKTDLKTSKNEAENTQRKTTPKNVNCGSRSVPKNEPKIDQNGGTGINPSCPRTRLGLQGAPEPPCHRKWTKKGSIFSPKALKIEAKRALETRMFHSVNFIEFHLVIMMWWWWRLWWWGWWRWWWRWW